MRGTGRATNTACVNFWLLAFALLVPFGCSAVTGRPLGSQPPRYPMLASAKSAVQGTGLALPRELDLQVLPPYVVEPGDVLLVVAVDLDSPVRMPGDQPVLPDGTINLGRYGRIVVAGRTVNEIEAVVHAAVQAQAGGKDIGAISVRLMTRVSKVYYVLGEVNAPGAFPLTGRETVLDGILAAGGLTDRASHSHIILSRPSPPDHCRIVLSICYGEIVQLGDTTTNYQLAPGDRIFVASKSTCEQLFPWSRAKSSCTGRQVPCSLAEDMPGCAGPIRVVTVSGDLVSAQTGRP
ncbi:MAG TPA: SLBB domain-containing protein [Gemmataceae bacterium]|nr:SLBB domain-containing protein [Gemmataceae bacterium]